MTRTKQALTAAAAAIAILGLGVGAGSVAAQSDSGDRHEAMHSAHEAMHSAHEAMHSAHEAECDVIHAGVSMGGDAHPLGEMNPSMHASHHN